MIERPDWNYDSSGNALVPAAPSPEAVTREVATLEGPSVATQCALAHTFDGAIAMSRSAPAKRGVDGIMRADWDKSRDKAGRFLSKSDAELRGLWQREGGYEANLQRVLVAEQAMLAASENPDALPGHIAALPDAIARKAADHMRLSTTYGAGGGALKAEQFLNSLSESEIQEVRRWFGQMSRSDQDAVIAGFFSK